MPSVADLQLAASPLDDPLSYPGETLDANYLLLDPWLYDIAPRLGTGPGQWRIRVDGGPLAALAPNSVVQRGAALLDDALALVAAPALRARNPVMAFGSNCSPAQLLDKFAGLPRRHRVVPVMRGVVRGLAVSHSPHISPSGYLPYALVRSDPETELRIFLLWLDPEQLRVLNRTEPNYRLDIVDRFPIVVETGDTITSYHAYRGRWGALRAPGSDLSIAPSSQSEILGILRATGWFADLVGKGEPGQLVSRLAGDPLLRDRIRRELASRGQVNGDGLGAAADAGE